MDTSITIGLAGAASSKTEAHSVNSAVQFLTSVEPSDEALLGRICQHDNDALAVLFRRYARIVRGVAYRVLRDPSEADDLLQDVFLLIPRLSGSFDGSKGSAKSWILQMTYRRALCRRRYLTTRHFYNRLDLDQVAEEVPDPRSTTGWPDHSLE